VNGSLNCADSLCNVEEHEAAETNCITAVHIDDPACINVETQDPYDVSIAVVRIDDPACSNVETQDLSDVSIAGVKTDDPACSNGETQDLSDVSVNESQRIAVLSTQVSFTVDETVTKSRR
jgi:hypothetical protein